MMRESMFPSPATPASDARVTDERPYLLERVGEAAVVQLYADGFNTLSPNEKRLAWHLYQAAVAGRDIYYDQRYVHNLEMRDVLEAVSGTPAATIPNPWPRLRATRSSSGSTPGRTTTSLRASSRSSATPTRSRAPFGTPTPQAQRSRSPQAKMWTRCWPG